MRNGIANRDCAAHLHPRPSSPRANSPVAPIPTGEPRKVSRARNLLFIRNPNGTLQKFLAGRSPPHSDARERTQEVHAPQTAGRVDAAPRRAWAAERAAGGGGRQLRGSASCRRSPESPSTRSGGALRAPAPSLRPAIERGAFLERLRSRPPTRSDPRARPCIFTRSAAHACVCFSRACRPVCQPRR